MKKNNIIYIVCAIIAIVAVVIIAIMGLNVSIRYSASTQVEIYLGKDFDNSEIEAITKDVIGSGEVIVQKVEVYGEIALITVKDISNEQLETLNAKINEKYELDNTVEDAVISKKVANVRIQDMVIPYILPTALSLIVILVYAGFRFKNISILEVLGKIVGFIVLAELLFISVLAITRFPINQFIIPACLAIYVIIAFVVVNSFDKKEVEE